MKKNNTYKHAATGQQGHRDKNQGILYISAGLPGAGKSTFLQKHKLENEIIISRDKIRFSLVKEDEPYFSRENTVFDTFVQRCSQNLREGKNVYADATHLTPDSQLKLLAPILLEASPREIVLIIFNTPVSICIKRNEQRKGTRSYCPPEQIRKMARYARLKPCTFIDKTYIVDQNGNISKER